MCDKPKEFSYGRCFSIIYRHGKTINDRMIRKFHLSGGQSRYLARICDNPGISQEELPHVWDRYYRASSNYVRPAEGSHRQVGPPHGGTGVREAGAKPGGSPGLLPVSNGTCEGSYGFLQRRYEADGASF